VTEKDPNVLQAVQWVRGIREHDAVKELQNSGLWALGNLSERDSVGVRSLDGRVKDRLITRLRSSALCLLPPSTGVFPTLSPPLEGAVPHRRRSSQPIGDPRWSRSSSKPTCAGCGCPISPSSRQYEAALLELECLVENSSSSTG